MDLSFTTILWVILYVGALVGSLVNPLFGAIGYLLEYYMRPELKWWGKELPALRYNLIIAVAFGVTYLLRRDSLRQMVPVKNPLAWWLWALAGWMIVVTLGLSVSFKSSSEWLTQWFKMAVIFPLLLAAVLRTRNAFNLFIAAHMLGAFWWGYDAWIRPQRAQGRLLNIGSGDTLNDNAASAHLLTVLPFIIVYLLTEKDKRLRMIALISAPFVINTLILCNSRGAIVGLAVAMVAAIFLVPSGYRTRLAGATVAVGLSFFLLADQTFIKRQQTTTQYEEDGSAQGRLETWRGSFRLFWDHPLGVGGRGFHLLSPVYIPSVVAAHGGHMRAPHNTWIMVAAEWGLPGFILFVGLHVSAFLMLRRLKRRVRDLPDDYTFYYWRAFALQMALIAGLAASTFGDRLYGESGYWMLALTFALYRMQLTDAAAREATSTAAGAAAPEVEPIPSAYEWSPAGMRAR